MDVLTTAWTAAGEPDAVPDADAHTGDCARCGTQSTRLTATRRVVSRVFTGVDGWHNLSGPGLCPPCTWGYRTPELRTTSHVVSTSPELRPLAAGQLEVLLSTPTPSYLAVIVPLRPGRKHLLPEASWGRVTVDDAQLPWGLGDTMRLAAMRRLRNLGFGSRMLTEPAPPWHVLRRIPRAHWPAILTDWPALDPWRRRRPWFDLAAHATKTTGKAAASPTCRTAPGSGIRA